MLCLCDQSITSIHSNDLLLPFLKELYLHRNQITDIATLAGCPRLQKLWLFQNQLKSIDFLINTLPELEDLWIQGNFIDSLDGIETLPRLRKLAVAGNPIKEYTELQPLSTLKYLQELSCNDIHFGKCPIAEDINAYKSYVTLYLKGRLVVLDGVRIADETKQKAADHYYNEMDSLQQSIRMIEEEYVRSLRELDLQYSNRESYRHILEKEMTGAMK